MMKWLLFIAVSLMAFANASVAAELEITAASASELARKQNPELIAARLFIAESEARAKSAGRLTNPEVDSEIAGGKDSEGRVSIGLSQRFPITTRLRLERNLSQLDIERARLEVKEKERQIALAAYSAFYELAYAREAILLASQQTEVVKGIVQSIQNSASEGLASGLDANQAVLAGKEFAVAKESLGADEAMAAGKLATLLGISGDIRFSVNKPLLLPKSLPANCSIGYRPDLQLAEMAVKTGAVEVSLAEASRWEDVGVGVFVEGERFRDEPEGIEPEALMGVRLNIPLPIWQNGSGKVAEKQAAKLRQQSQLEALRLTALNQALAAHRAMAAYYRAATQTQSQVLPAARQQVSDTDAAYQRGEADLQTVLRAHERLAAIEITALEAKKKFHLSHSEWLAAIGEPSSKP